MNATRNRTHSECHGFTLLELLAVLAVSAILAGAVVVSLRGPYQTARLKNAVERLVLADRQMRDHARRFAQSAQIVMHLDRGTMAGVQLPSGNVSLPAFSVDGMCMDQLIVGGRRIDCGEAAISVSSRGQTPTYAIRFKNPQGEHQWLVFLGITGQSICTDNEREIEALQRLATTRRPDAG